MMPSSFTTNDPDEPDDAPEIPVSPDELRLVLAIRSRFPVESALTDQSLRARSSDPSDFLDIPRSWVEAFADRTADAIKARDAQCVQQHTQFFAEQFEAGTDAVREIIDVAYTENMMWKAQDADKVWAWQFIAEDIRRLYAQIWPVPGT
jgi:hypothetical protein